MHRLGTRELRDHIPEQKAVCRSSQLSTPKPATLPCKPTHASQHVRLPPEPLRKVHAGGQQRVQRTALLQRALAGRSSSPQEAMQPRPARCSAAYTPETGEQNQELSGLLDWPVWALQVSDTHVLQLTTARGLFGLGLPELALVGGAAVLLFGEILLSRLRLASCAAGAHSCYACRPKQATQPGQGAWQDGQELPERCKGVHAAASAA